MAIDVFANNSSAVVSAGGTTAPAAGTSETWTLASIVGLSASDTGTPATKMRLIDPALQSEIIWLTNLSGTTATVMRGAEGTVPVAHTSGFTVQVVVTADVFDRMNTGMRSIRFRPGQFYTGMTSGFTNESPSSTPSNSDGRLVSCPFPVPVLTSFDQALVYCTTASDNVGAVVRVGIYRDSGDGIPQDLVRDFGAADITTTGLKTFDLTGDPLVLDADLYWTVMVAQNVAAGTVNPQFWFSGAGGLPGYAFDNSFANKAANGAWTTSEGKVTGALPAHLTTVTPTINEQQAPPQIRMRAM